MLNAHLLQLHSLLAGLFLLCRPCVGIKSLMGYPVQGPGMINFVKLKSDVASLMSLEALMFNGKFPFPPSHEAWEISFQPMIHMNHPAMKLD